MRSRFGGCASFSTANRRNPTLDAYLDALRRRHHAVARRCRPRGRARRAAAPSAEPVDLGADYRGVARYSNTHRLGLHTGPQSADTDRFAEGDGLARADLGSGGTADLGA